MLSALLEYLWILWEGIAELLYDSTIWFTKYAFSRRPLTPKLTVLAVRCNRVKLFVDTKLATWFNVETYEIQRAELGADADDTWVTCQDDEGRHASVKGLSSSKDYGFRVRAKNYWGVTPWSPVVRVHTPIDPVAGGGLGPGYSWQQSATEVQLEFPLLGCETLRAKQVEVQLKVRMVTVKVHMPEGVATLLEGELSEGVKRLGEGSFWEIHKDRASGVTNLVLTLEKDKPAQSAAYDTPGKKRAGVWSCVVTGHPKIDTTRVLDF